MDYFSNDLSSSRKQHKKKHHSQTFRPETFTASVSDVTQDDAGTVGESENADEARIRRKKLRKDAKSDRAAADEEDRDDAQFASQLIDAALPAQMLVDAGEVGEPVKKKRKERTRVVEAAVPEEGETVVVEALEVDPSEEPAHKKKRRSKVAETGALKSEDAGENLGAFETDTEAADNGEKLSSQKKKADGIRIAAAIPVENFTTRSDEAPVVPKGILRKGSNGTAVDDLVASAKPVSKAKPLTKTWPSKPATNGYVDPAVTYLRLWKSARSAWTFQKVRQVWLLRNWRDRLKMSDADFLILLDYIVELKGGSRAKTAEEAKGVRDEYEASETYGADDELKQKLYERAGKIVEILSAEG